MFEVIYFTNFNFNIERGVCFEDVIALIHDNKVIDIVQHPNEDKDPHQKMYIVNLMGYIYMVPFVKNSDEIFLKTIVPNRKLNKLYGGK